MNKQDLEIEIYYELDMIRVLSRITGFAAENGINNLDEDSYSLVFKDIEKRCWEISEKVEQLIQPGEETEGVN
jgi:hypothetical protein